MASSPQSHFIHPAYDVVVGDVILPDCLKCAAAAASIHARYKSMHGALSD